MDQSPDVVEMLARRIDHKYRDFQIDSIRHLASGQYNDAVLINDNWIFRVPRHELGAINLKNEILVLQHLQGRLPLQIPTPTHTHIDLQMPAESFMGYPQISGVPLSRQTALGMNAHELINLADRINHFVETLHGLEISHEIDRAMNHVDTFADWSHLYEKIQRHLFAHMRPDAREEVRQHFETFLDSCFEHSIHPKLIHGDIGAGNILLDEHEHKAIAVIDFGSVEIGDPATDYAAISTIHPQMLGLLIQRNPEVRRYVDRIHFYRGTFALQEAVYGAETGDEWAFRAGIQQYI